MVDYGEKTSEYNEALFQLTRLNNIWVQSGNLIESGKLIGARWKLDRAKVELWYDAKRLDKNKKDENEKYTVQINKIDTDISNSIKNKDYETLYNKLIDKMMLLKEIQNESGKGAKYGFVDDDDLD